MTDPTPPSSEEPNLGETLRRRRLRLGRSIEQIAAQTRIQAKMLEAIEDNRYSELPAEAFTRGFLAAYAKALGLNPTELMAQHGEFLKQKLGERKSRDQGHQGYAFESKEIEQNRRWLVIGGSLLAVFGLIVILIFKPQNKKRLEKHKEFAQTTKAEASPSPHLAGAEGLPIVPSSEAAKDTQKKTAPTPAINPPVVANAPAVASRSSPSPSPAPSATPTAEKTDSLQKGDDLAPSKVRKKLVLLAQEDTVVRYQSDNRSEMKFILRAGKYLVIKAENTIRFQTEKPENLRFRPTNSREFQPLADRLFEVQDSGVLNALPSW